MYQLTVLSLQRKCKPKYDLHVLSLVFLSLIGAYADENRCSPGTYHDEVTNRCASCTDICVNARVQGTEDQCNQKCPGYNLANDKTTTPPKCPQGQYYDPAVDRCDYCSVLCVDSIVQGTTQDCKSKCPEYFRKQESVNKSTSVPVAVIVGVVLAAVVVIMVATYALLTLCCEQRLPPYLRMHTCMPCVFRGHYKKPIECTEDSSFSSGSSQSIMNGTEQPESCAVPLEETDTAFVDMQFSRQCSRDENDT